MEIVSVPINDLKPADYNPRTLSKEQYSHLKESLERFGFVDPIVANKNESRKNIVVGGHQRLGVAKDLGFTEVPVVYVDLDEQMEKELNLRLNKNVGSWDMDMLANSFPEDMLVSVGFSDIELHGIPEVTVEPIDEDRQEEPRTRRGWRLKCPKCGFSGAQDEYSKADEGEPESVT